MVTEAVAAGELLLEVKGQLQHGEFGPFLTYCGVSARSARVYMRLARNSGSAAVLEADSIRAALNAIAGPSPRPKRLDFGPPHPPSHAADLRWQRDQWLQAMAAAGRRDVPELRRHFTRDGEPRKGVGEREAQRWSKSFLCPVCRKRHTGGRRIADEGES
jgi:hypothetical protein